MRICFADALLFLYLCAPNEKNKQMKKTIHALLLIFMNCVLPILGQPQWSAPTKVFLMHSSGNHLKMDEANGGRLEAPTAEHPQRITFIPDGKGYYSLQADNADLFLSLSGSWNTLFIADSASSQAKFAIERATGSFVRLRCKANSKCLGTDGSSAEQKVFADKSGSDILHYWYFADSPTAEAPCDTITYPVVPMVRQSFEGWGVSLCWWANMCGKWSDEKIDELVDWMVSEDGLNFNIFRYNIGGGDDPENRNCTAHHMGKGKGLRAEMEGFKDFSGDVYHWERDEAQRKIMLKIREKRPDAIFEAFSNSAPYYMTYSGCVAGNTDANQDNLKPEYYEEFAHYLVDVCKHYQDEYGIIFRTLEPFNEPVTNYWKANGGQEGCHFSTNAQISFLKVLQQILKESGLPTVISSSDETDVSQGVKDFSTYQTSGALQMLGQWNTHTYQHSISGRTKQAFLAHQAGLPLWMSEVGAKGDLSLAQVLFDDIRYLQPIAWADWQYMEENGSTWGMIGGNFSDQTYYKMKKYFTRQQCSRFIRPGYDIVTSLNNQSLAALSPQRDTLVVVLLNEGVKVVHHLNLTAFDDVYPDIEAYRTSDTEDMAKVNDCFDIEGHQLHVLLPAQSITTLLIPVATRATATPSLQTDCDYLIVPRNETTRCVAVKSDGTLQLADIDAEQPQTWRLTADGMSYRLSNADGLTITASRYATSNVLKALPTATDYQSFAIEPTDYPYFKIVPETEPQYAMELVSEKTTAGTAVKLWRYDDGNAPTHRQWMLVAMPTNSSDDIKDVMAKNAGSLGMGDGVYNLAGMRVVSGVPTPMELRQLSPGYYVVVCEGLAKKMVVR